MLGASVLRCLQVKHYQNISSTLVFMILFELYCNILIFFTYSTENWKILLLPDKMWLPKILDVSESICASESSQSASDFGKYHKTFGNLAMSQTLLGTVFVHKKALFKSKPNGKLPIWSILIIIWSINIKTFYIVLYPKEMRDLGSIVFL